MAAPYQCSPSRTTLGSPKSRSQMSGRGATAARPDAPGVRRSRDRSADAVDEPGTASSAGSATSAASAPVQRVRCRRMWKVPLRAGTLDTPAPRGGAMPTPESPLSEASAQRQAARRPARRPATPARRRTSGAATRAAGASSPGRPRTGTAAARTSTRAGTAAAATPAVRRSRRRRPGPHRPVVARSSSTPCLGRRPVEQRGRPAPDRPVGAAPEVALRQQHHVALGPLARPPGSPARRRGGTAPPTARPPGCPTGSSGTTRIEEGMRSVL